MRAPEQLRNLAWEIAAARPQDRYVPASNYVTLAIAGPRQGLVTWRVLEEWVEQTGATRADSWAGRRLVLRLYDVTLVDFDGFNAHRIFDIPLEHSAGERLFGADVAGRGELAEVGFLLPSGEFIPAARSQPVHFPSGTVAPEHDPSALYVDAELRVEPVPSPWEAERWLARRGAPELRNQLRIAVCTFESAAVGDQGASATFASELAGELGRRGHEVHVVVPSKPGLSESRRIDGVEYHPVELGCGEDPVEMCKAFGRAAQARLEALGRFDLRHAHEWMAGSALDPHGTPRLLSLSSTEQIRLGSNPPTSKSRQIESAEHAVACAADCVLVPEHLHAQVPSQLGLGEEQVIPFPLEGRFLDEWESPLDVGDVKKGVGLGPFDRVFLFVGPMEWGRGPDLLVEALPTILRSHANCRLVFVGLGDMLGHVEHRAHELGIGYAVRFLGHVEGHALVRLLRAAEAVVLPSRQRTPNDEGVVALARRAGRAVITTHSGPGYLVGHEHNGLVTYDNPGSLVWAIGQFLGDAQLGEILGSMGRSLEDRRPQWSELVTSYTRLCASLFPELTAAAPPSAKRTQPSTKALPLSAQKASQE